MIPICLISAPTTNGAHALTRTQAPARRTTGALILGALLLSGSMALAADSVSNESVTNYSGIITQNGGAFELVPAQTKVTLSNRTGGPVTGTYRVGFKLVTGANTVVAGETFSTPFTTTVGVNQTISGTLSVNLAPSSIVSGTKYRVAAQLYKQVTVTTWATDGASDVSGDYRWAVVPAGADSGVVGWLNSLSLTRGYAVATIAGGESFQVGVQGIAGRLDQVAQPVSSDNYQLFFDATLHGTNSGDVPLVNARTAVPVALANHTVAGKAASVAINQTLNLQPAAQLDSTDTYSITITLSSAGADNVETLQDTRGLQSQTLLHFNGTLLFGTASTQILALAGPPAIGGITPGTNVAATIGIPIGGAALTGLPLYTLTFTTNIGTLQVSLLPGGTAQVTSGTAFVSAPNFPDTAMVNGVSFTRGNDISLDPVAGATASVNVNLPAGFGIGIGAGTRRLLGSYYLGSISLDGSLAPTGIMTLSPSELQIPVFYAVHDELPLTFASTGIDWDVAAGTFTVHRASTKYVRADEMNALDTVAPTLPNPGDAVHPSNDGYFRHPADDAGMDVVIATDAQGRAALATAQIDLPPSNFTAHFPAGANIAWSQNGAVFITNGAIDTAQSSLPGANPVTFLTSPGAPTNPPPVAADTFTFTPDSAWTFTSEGGLTASGTIAAAPLRWGARDAADYANVTDNFSAASAHVPGSVLHGGDATTTNDNRPGELLLTGHAQPGDASYVERPNTPDYESSGLADYAGLNFRVAADGAQHASSLIGNASVGPYPLRATCKYYVRGAGLSGIHEAVTSAFAAQAGSLIVYGFPLSLNNYQLSFLDNTNLDSLVNGTVNVPGARGNAGFAQPFVKLIFDFKNNPSEVILPDPNPFEHTLTYWHATLAPATCQFQPNPSDASTYALVFGGEVRLRGVLKDPIHGVLGFLKDGRMVAAANGFPGLNSRIKPPKLIGLHGTGSLTDATRPAFNVHPVSDIYFNDPYAKDAANVIVAPDSGFVAFAGTVDVSFFQDLKVHVIAGANGGDAAVRGGWTEATGANFFNNAKFDGTNRGFPSFDSFANYLNDAEPHDYYDPNAGDSHSDRNNYNVLATQSWMHFVDFTMPVTWDPALRRFTSSVPEQRNFLVVNSQRVLKQLTPSGAEIRFGLQFNNIPRLNLAALVIDEQEASRELIGLIPHGSDLVAGTQAFAKLLNNKSDDLINNAVSTAVDGVIDAMFAQFTTSGAQSAQDAVNQLNAAIGAAGGLHGQLQDSLGGVIGDVSKVNTVMSDFADALVKITNGLGTADDLLQKDGQDKRGTFVTSTINLALQTAGVPGDERDQITGPIDTLINGDLRSTLDDIQDAITEVRSLSNAASGFVGEVQLVTQTALMVANGAGLPDQVLGTMRDYFATAAKNDPTHQYLTEIDLTKVKADLKRVALEAITQSSFVTDLQSTIHDAIEPLQDEYQAAFDQIFGVMNDVVHSALQEVSSQVVDKVNENLGTANRAIGGFNDALRMTQVTGDAHIVGDVLDSAKINANLAMNFGGPVRLRGTLDFKRFGADQPAPSCAGGGSPDGRMQITLTGEGNSGIAGCPPLHVKALGQYTMQSNGSPLALSGGLSVDAGLHLDILSLKHAEFDFAFGAYDNYLYGEASGSILIFDADVKAFIGRTCDPAVIGKVDPLLNDVLDKAGLPKPVSQANPVSGIYFNAVGDIVLNRLFGIPDDVITLKGRGGQGRFVFMNDHFADPSQFTIIPGMRWDVGLTVGISVVTAGAEIQAVGALSPQSLLQNGDDVGDIVLSMFNPVSGGIHGVIDGVFTAKGPFGFSKDFDFSAQGQFFPLPPPGTFFVNKLNF